jgi:hypothetical protein
MTFYPIPDDPDFQPITGIPDDYARCGGRTIPDRRDWRWHPQCHGCLRRTTPRMIGYGSFMAPPDFTTTCPERIAP